MTKYKRILIIKLGALGDFIQLTGFYSAIRKQYPNAHITLLTTKPFVKLAKASPYFNDILVDNRSRNPLDWYHVIKKVLLDGDYDLIYDLQNQKRTRSRYYNLTRFFTNKPLTWALYNKGNFLARYTPAKHRFTMGHQEKLIIPFKAEMATLDFCKADPKVLALLPKKYVLLIPGCSPDHPYKRWPAKSYKELAHALAQQNIHTVVIGTNAEKPEIDLICDQNSYAINFCNKSALFDIPEIANKSMAVVGNDTGPQHMAELGTIPVITLFCDITKTSAVKRPNVTNIIEKNIADISVKRVLDTLYSLWHKA